MVITAAPGAGKRHREPPVRWESLREAMLTWSSEGLRAAPGNEPLIISAKDSLKGTEDGGQPLPSDQMLCHVSRQLMQGGQCGGLAG